MSKLFELHEGDNIGGISRILIAHITDFQTFNPVVFKPNKGWIKIDFTPESASVKGEEIDSENGNYFNYAGSFRIHHQTTEVSRKIRRYIGKMSVIKVIDQNGRSRVIGTPTEPVTVSRSSNTGSSYTDQNHNALSFEVSQLNPALI